MHDKHSLNTHEKIAACATCGVCETGCAGCGGQCGANGIPSPFESEHADDCRMNVCADCNGMWHEAARMYDHSETCPIRIAATEDTFLARFLAHTVKMRDAETLPPIGAVMRRSDGAPLLYARRLSTIYGVPGTGKSWVALLAAQSAIQGGGRVLWLDFEDNQQSLARRAQAIGFREASNSNFFQFTRPSLYSDELAVQAAAQWLKDAAGASLVVLDSATSAGCPSDGSDVGEWYQAYVEPFKAREIAMLLIDHIPKRTTDRGIGAIGSQHKLAILNGAAIRVGGKPWTGYTDGKITLTLEKDRQGQLPAQAGHKVAVINGEWIDGVLRCTIEAPSASERGVPVRDRVLDTIASTEGGVLGQARLRELVGGKGAEATKALKELIDSGNVLAVKEGRAFRYSCPDIQDTMDTIEE